MSTVSCAAFPPPQPSSHPVDVGRRSEAAVLGLLLKLGYSVSVPQSTNQRYDLIVDAGRLLKVQVKTGRNFVPIEHTARGQGYLRVHPTVNKQARGVRWARDYELPPIHPEPHLD